MEHHDDARRVDRMHDGLTRTLTGHGRRRRASRLHPPTTGLLAVELVDGAFELPDLRATGNEQLRELIAQLEGVEHELSYHRRILHGKIDLLRAERVHRLRERRDR